MTAREGPVSEEESGRRGRRTHDWRNQPLDTLSLVLLIAAIAAGVRDGQVVDAHPAPTFAAAEPTPLRLR